MIASLDRLLRPKSIALIGGDWAENAVAACASVGFDGAVWPVHPRRATVGGVRAYPSVEALPGAPDAAFVAVNRRVSVEVVQALAARGAGGAVCFASGFAESEQDEAGGAALQDALVAAAGDMPLIGPNCYGVLNYFDGAALWPDQHGGARTDRGVALIAQSSDLVINLTSQRRGLPIGYAMTVGNQAQTSLGRLIQATLDDPRVTAVGLYVEGFGDLDDLQAAAAQARTLRKPIFAIKAGDSALSRSMAESHTAALAGAPAAARALLRRLGIAQVADASTLLDALTLAHVHGALPGRRLAVLGSSGGESAMVADAAERFDVDLPPLSQAARARLRAVLGPRVALSNPLDYHTYIWDRAEPMRETFAALFDDDYDLTAMFLDTPRSDRCDGASWRRAEDWFVETAQARGARAAVMSIVPETMEEARARSLIARGVAPFAGVDEALGAVEAAARVGTAWARPEPARLAPAPPSPGASLMFDEADAKALLCRAGVPTPEGAVAASVAEARAAADRLGGTLAVKALGLAHKTEVGGVRLGLEGADAVAEAAAALLELTGRLLIERMAPRPTAELLVGASRDPAVGLTLTLGWGGVLAELIDDTRTLTLPTSRAEIRDALSALKIGRLIDGWRGAPPADLDAVLDAAEACARFCAQRASDIDELDVNPLLVGPWGALAVDAFLKMRESGEERRLHGVRA